MPTPGDELHLQVPNSYFRFKQFTVHQDRCAMKVCTDACLFGAWLTKTVPGNQERILDIGAGTGLLSLMLAQTSRAIIDAVELDPAAAEQTGYNFQSSPWGERLHVFQGDARTFSTGNRYSLIISNPPFFENDLPSADRQRNLALHSSALGWEELMDVMIQNIAPAGRLAVLLPFHRKDEMLRIAAARSYLPSHITDVRQTEKHAYFRTMMVFSTGEIHPIKDSIVIRERNTYSQKFTDLLKDYYLAF